MNDKTNAVDGQPENNAFADTVGWRSRNKSLVSDYCYKMVKTGQFTTKCKGNKVIALKLQKSLWWDSA